MSLQREKEGLRRMMRQELSLLSLEEKMMLSSEIRAQLSSFLDRKESLRIASFAARSWEVDLLPLVQAYPQHAWYFPRSLDARHLAFHRVLCRSELVCGRYNILEPCCEAEKVEVEYLDIVLVPGIAFTCKGSRLGYGGGFYDGFLAQAVQALHIGVCFPIQVLEALPMDKHDLPVQYLLTGQYAAETTDACPSCRS